MWEVGGEGLAPYYGADACTSTSTSIPGEVCVNSAGNRKAKCDVPTTDRGVLKPEESVSLKNNFGFRWHECGRGFDVL